MFSGGQNPPTPLNVILRSPIKRGAHPVQVCGSWHGQRLNMFAVQSSKHGSMDHALFYLLVFFLFIMKNNNMTL